MVVQYNVKNNKIEPKIRKQHQVQKKIFFLYNHLLAEKNILKIFGKIQSVQFPTANNISKIHENRRQKSASGSAGLCTLRRVVHQIEWRTGQRSFSVAIHLSWIVLESVKNEAEVPGSNPAWHLPQ